MKLFAILALAGAQARLLERGTCVETDCKTNQECGDGDEVKF